MTKTFILLINIILFSSCIPKKESTDSIRSFDQAQKQKESPSPPKIVKQDSIYLNSFKDFIDFVPTIKLPYEVNCKPNLNYNLNHPNYKIVVVDDDLRKKTRGVVATFSNTDSTVFALRLEPADVSLPFLVKFDIDGNEMYDYQLLSLMHCAHDPDDSLDYNSMFRIDSNLNVTRIDYTYLQTTMELLDSAVYQYTFQ